MPAVYLLTDSHGAAGDTLRQRRLAAVHRRAVEAEGLFWCSVVTTRIYCRPTCPARRARPENIRFHDTIESARATGFRPCRRCRPEEPSLHERYSVVIAAACQRLAASRSSVPVKVLAEAAGFSPAHFYRVFRKVTGASPQAYAKRTRAGPRQRPPSPSRFRADPVF